MTWAKVDDGYDEELAHLSHSAFRLYTAAITYSRRRELGGFLCRRDVETLCRAQRITGLTKVIEELLDATADNALWVREGDGYVVVAYEKYNPPTSTERVRRFRGTGRNVSATPPQPNETVSPAGAPAPGPVPVPQPVPKEAKASKKVESFADDITQVLDAWTLQVVAQYGPRSKPMRTPERERLIRARLEQGFTLSDSLLVVRGWRNSQHHVDGRFFDITLLFRDGAHFERFREMALAAPPPHRRTPSLDEVDRGGDFKPFSSADFDRMRQSA